MTDTSRRNRRLLIAVTAALASASIVLPVIGVLLAPRIDRQNAANGTTTTTPTPALNIKPLSVRPVLTAFVTTPEECPPPVPSPPPDQPLRTCDITRLAVYELGPEEARLQLTDVDSFKNPLTNGHIVQMSMTAQAAQDFARFTAAHIDQQVAFVRGGIVVWGPKITTPIDGQVLQLSGDLTPEQAADIARMLRDEA